MPKLSNARRHRRQLNLAGYCVNPTVRKVSEDDIQEQTSSAAGESSSQDEQISGTGPLLKRREPSTCLSELCFLSPLPQAAEPVHENQEDPEATTSRTISPVWGHFVDVILDDEQRQSPTPTTHYYELNKSLWPSSSRAHSPYGESARKRLRIQSPKRPIVQDEMDGFILQHPSALHDALSRLSV